jgi:hypothetical protein
VTAHLRLERLHYSDEELAALELPGGCLRITRGLGSGLSRNPLDDPGLLWSVGDRGPNLKVPRAVDHYGLKHLEPFRNMDGVKILPFPDIGPAISQLRISGDRVELLRTIPIRGRSGQPISGRPPLYGRAEETEPALAVDGTLLPPDPSGADTEGLAVAPDGDFWVADEYGPSLFQIAPDGVVRRRLVPAGSEDWFLGADYPVEAVLPAIATRRRLNRGFEGLAISEDGRWLFAIFQSPLANPDLEAHLRARHVRIWKVSTETGMVTAQFIYPLDPPKSFRRDRAKGDIDRADIKIGEIAMLAGNRLLVLERCSLTSKLYVVELNEACSTGAAYFDASARPTIEQLSASGDLERHMRVLTKDLLLSTDDHPEIGGDIEGIAVVGPGTIVIVNDNDFGIDGAKTFFWRIDSQRAF